MNDFQAVKALVKKHTQNFDAASDEALTDVLGKRSASDYQWRGSRPFYEQSSVSDAVQAFWLPLRRSFSHLQRREDVFFAGANDCDDGASVWTCSMGHFMGLFDQPFVEISPTRRLTYLRYAEFTRVSDGEIAEQAVFIDLIGLMGQAGVYPLAPSTGSYFMYPGPKTHDGLVLDVQNPAEGRKTLDLVNDMAAGLSKLNKAAFDNPPPEFLAEHWHDDMAWYGPCGIGATYTISRYQLQHQYPFRQSLTDKVFNGHVARIAEGDYCAFFGWPNLSNRNSGGFLGQVGSNISADMRVVDVYRRSGLKLAENWVIIDLPHYLAQQGLDVLERMVELRR